MTPNFWRYFLTLWIRARAEGLRFGLEELKQLFSIKRNSGFPGTMILALRPGRSIIDGIPNRDDRWREKFFVFKINPASLGDFDFEWIPREWCDVIGRFLKFFFCFLFRREFYSSTSFGVFNFSLLIYRTLWSCAYESRASRTDCHSAAR